MKRNILLLLVCCLSASAASIHVASGGIILNTADTSTAGTHAEPWSVDERMTGPGALIIRDFDAGNPTGTFHSKGRWFRKTVRNDMGVHWTSFELELQLNLGTPSNDFDGISFADESFLRFFFSSDKFSNYIRDEFTRDALIFKDGQVRPGETVTFNFIITDQFDNNPFYLVQTPRIEIPEPSTWALLASGLLLGAARARKR